jgi:glutathione synthase/RimK-type ligase-like ATP-grasp enzyme
VRIAFAISRAASVDETWTTVHLAREALVRGWQVRFVEPWDFEVDPTGRLIARAHAFDVPASADELATALAERRAPRKYVELDRLGLMLLRAAPFDLSVLTFGAMVKARGVPVFNDPDGLLRVTSKAWLASLVDVPTPAHAGHAQPRLVPPVRRPAPGRRRAQAVARQRRPPGVVRPGRRRRRRRPRVRRGARRWRRLRGRPGLPPRRRRRREAPRVAGRRRRRGVPSPPCAGEFRHNLKRGGQAEPTDISAADRALGRSLAPHLLRAGIRLAGIDVIGGRVIEVNALNPGGAFHADRLGGTRLGALILDRLIQRPEEPTPWAAPVL